MPGVEIGQKNNLLWVGASAAALAVSLGLGIGVGPSGIYAASCLGGLLALAALLLNPRQMAAVLLLVLHLVFLGVGAVLDTLFLKPLSNEQLNLPHLSQYYIEPEGLFSIRVPEGWDVEPIHLPLESGVRLRPADRKQYMGISELTVRVRELQNVPKKPSEFLNSMVQKMAVAPDRDKSLFEFSTRPATLINGEMGMWSHLILKRFWIPLYQNALFGFKGKRYLCSVSASGLKNHGTLSEVLCLGIFETVTLHPKHSKTP